MMIRQLDAQTGEWTEIEVPDPEPIPEPPRWTASKTVHETGEVFEQDNGYYMATQVIVTGESLVPGVNCDEMTMVDVINMIRTKEGE